MSDCANIRDGMNLGADDFLTKLFVSQELIRAVAKIRGTGRIYLDSARYHLMKNIDKKV
jgi:DNA-binding response OmpR family regulator